MVQESSSQEISTEEFCHVCGVDTGVKKPIHAFGCALSEVPVSRCQECHGTESEHRGWCSKHRKEYVSEAIKALPILKPPACHTPLLPHPYRCVLPFGHPGRHLGERFPESLDTAPGSTNPGVKFDQEKPRVDLLPPGALLQIAEVLRYGATKYSERNWEKGLARRRVLSAAIRHLFAYMSGEDLDPESGLPHVAHAGCCILFLIEYTILGIGDDERTLMYGRTESVGGRTGGAKQPDISEDNKRQERGGEAADQ